MSETTRRRKWKAYVCPACRLVFRVASDYSCHGVVCSSCHHMLRLPEPGEAEIDLIDPRLSQEALARVEIVRGSNGAARNMTPVALSEEPEEEEPLLLKEEDEASE